MRKYLVVLIAGLAMLTLGACVDSGWGVVIVKGPKEHPQCITLLWQDSNDQSRGTFCKVADPR